MFLELGEVDDLVVQARRGFPREPEEAGGEEDVLAGGEIGVETGAELDDRAEAPVDLHGPLRRHEDAREELQQRALARAVVT
ncbi:MAG: hypothetical protein M3478_02880, partial [Planctomycetota bacterium]|nr:hypothetical protein [Planctomycetota bacterium]